MEHSGVQSFFFPVIQFDLYKGWLNAGAIILMEQGHLLGLHQIGRLQYKRDGRKNVGFSRSIGPNYHVYMIVEVQGGCSTERFEPGEGQAMNVHDDSRWKVTQSAIMENVGEKLRDSHSHF